MGTPIIFFNNYILYGLNRERNFLKPSVAKKILPLESKSDVYDFCASTLHQCDCEKSGMFAVFLDGTYMAMAKEVNEDGFENFITAEDDDMHFFSEFDADFRLCCYSLIYQISNNQWRIAV